MFVIAWVFFAGLSALVLLGGGRINLADQVTHHEKAPKQFSSGSSQSGSAPVPTSSSSGTSDESSSSASVSSAGTGVGATALGAGVSLSGASSPVVPPSQMVVTGGTTQVTNPSAATPEVPLAVILPLLAFVILLTGALLRRLRIPSAAFAWLRRRG